MSAESRKIDVIARWFCRGLTGQVFERAIHHNDVSLTGYDLNGIT